MSDSPVTTAAVNKAAKAAGVAAAAVSDVLPTVVETTEIAAQIPTKVVLGQRLVVLTAAVTGVAVGAGALYGWNWFRNRKNNAEVSVPKAREGADEPVQGKTVPTA